MNTSKQGARERRPEGKEGTGAHQEGKNSVQAGQTQRRERTSPAKGQEERVDNDHQKMVSGKKQRGPRDKVGKDAGGNAGSRGQNFRSSGSQAASTSVGSHKPSGDGPGTKTFKHESDNLKRSTRRP
jgi:hypothetical protein